MKILIIQLAKMGDLIQSFPLIKALQKGVAKPEIYVLHSEIFSDVLSLIDCVKPLPVNLDLLAAHEDEQFLLKDSDYAEQMFETLKGFDYVINLNGTALAKAIISRVQSPHKKGFASGNEHDEKWLKYIISFMKNRELASFNLVDIFLKLNPFDNAYLPEKESRVEAKKQIALQLGSRNSKRHPLMSDFAKIANRLIENGYQIVLTGVQSELVLYEEFIPLIGQREKIFNKIGQTSLQELYHILDQSEYLISSDTGTMHLASLTNCRVFALFFGSAYPYETLAYKADTLVYFPDHAQISCYPCAELTPCPNKFICKAFAAEIVTDWILHKKENKALYKAVFDPLGQYLVPLFRHTPKDYQLYALLWRIASARYFLQKETSLADYLQYFLFTDEQLAKASQLIQREMSIANLTKEKGININELSDNYQFLSPLLIFNLFWQVFAEFAAIFKSQLPLRVDHPER